MNVIKRGFQVCLKCSECGYTVSFAAVQATATSQSCSVCKHCGMPLSKAKTTIAQPVFGEDKRTVTCWEEAKDMEAKLQVLKDNRPPILF